MKKIIFTSIVLLAPYWAFSQDCIGSKICDISCCGPEGTKTAEAAVITDMRAHLVSVIQKMSTSSISFDSQVAGMIIAKGTSDYESLLFISQAVSMVKSELKSKLSANSLQPALSSYKPERATTKQQMVANLKKEIQWLVSQVQNI